MKRKFTVVTFILITAAILTFSGISGAVEGPIGSINDELVINGEIGPYASVEAHKLQYDGGVVWGWTWWHGVEPGMDFGFFSGNPAQASKVKDTNCFVVETNTSLTVTFDSEPLTHVENSEITLPTTYWAFISEGVEEEKWPFNHYDGIPDQLRPAEEIGYFGETNVPTYSNGVNFPDFWDGLLYLLGVGSAQDAWPDNSEVMPERNFNGITDKGIYAFQVFGFAGMRENISSQMAGQYLGEICLTVAVN